MITLYYAPGACSFVPHVALEIIRMATGEDYEAKVIKLHKGEQRTPEYLAINPAGQVPTLVVEDQPLTQIVAIGDYLDRRFPDARLMPSEPWARAQAMSTLCWFNNTVHPTFTHVFMPQKFASDAAVQAVIREHATAQYRELLERIQTMAASARPFWLGERVSMLDAYALTLLRWGSLAGIEPSSLPAYRDYVARVAEAPAVAAVIAREGIKLEAGRKT